MGSVVLLGVFPETSRRLRSGLDDHGRTVEDGSNVDQMIARLRVGDDIDAVVLGRELNEPLRVVQQASAINPSVAIVILADPKRRDDLNRALRYIPFLGEDVCCIAMDPTTEVVKEVRDAADRAALRRAHQATVAALNRRLAVGARGEQRVVTYLERLLDLAPIGIVVVDQRGIVQAWNPRSSRLFGASEREAIGVPIERFLTWPSRRFRSDDLVDGSTADQESTVALVERLQSDGYRQFLETTSTRIGAPPNDATLILIQDVTDRVLAEREREEALAREQAARREAEAAARMREEFLSIAAHELKTPVTGLRASTQLLLRILDRTGTVEPARLRATLEGIEHQSAKLARLIAELLDATRIESGRLTLAPVSLNLTKLVRDVVAEARLRAPEHALELRMTGEVHAIVDPVRVEQILVNLLDNAVKFSPRGEAILIDVAERAPTHVEIAVTDHGIGIPPEHRPQLFQRFHQAHVTTHAIGLGLGLYISRQIAELHGGTLAAEFPDEGGTRFIVRLPLAGSDQTSPAERQRVP